MADHLEHLYALVPALACKGLCWDTCTTIPAGPAEITRARKAGGDLDAVTNVAQARQQLAAHYVADDMPPCPSLTAFGRCKVYAARPMICRIWGTTPTLACPHGCEPDGWLDEAQATALLAAAMTAQR